MKTRNGTHQDRLIKKLRRASVADYIAANGYLTATYWTGHNTRFARAPAAPEDFHTPVPTGVDLDQVFRLETTRTVGHDWVVRHANRLLQVDRCGRHYPPARSAVQVCEYEDGHLEVWYRGQRVPWTEITGRAHPTHPPAVPRDAPPTPPRLRPPTAQHPWRRAFRDLPDRLSPGEAIPGHVAPLLYGGAR